MEFHKACWGWRDARFRATAVVILAKFKCQKLLCL